MLAQHTFLEKREDQFADTASSTRPTHEQIRYPLVDPQEIFREAREYFHLFHHEHGTLAATALAALDDSIGNPSQSAICVTSQAQKPSSRPLSSIFGQVPMGE